MEIKYTGVVADKNKIKYAVKQNNNANIIVFKIERVQDGGLELDITKNFYIKAKSCVKCTFIDKERIPASNILLSEDNNYILISYVLRRKYTQFKNIDVQIQYEDGMNDIVWQTAIINIDLFANIPADQMIEDLYPSILMQLQNEIDGLDERVAELEEGKGGAEWGKLTGDIEDQLDLKEKFEEVNDNIDDVADDLDQEQTDREQADSVLSQAIHDEEVERKAKDAELKGLIDNIEVAWGKITGDIEDQEDLQEALAIIRAIAEGNTKSYSVDTDVDGNEAFKSNDVDIVVEEFTDINGNLIQTSDLKNGDLIFTKNTSTTTYQDRWLVDKETRTWSILSADDPRLENYFTKSEINALLALKADISSVYTKQETDDLLDEKANKDTENEFTEKQIFTNGIDVAIIDHNGDIVFKRNGVVKFTIKGNIIVFSKNFNPETDGEIDIGGIDFRVRDLYLSRNLTDGTNTISIASIVQKINNIINIGEYQTIEYGMVFPKITLNDAKKIYNAFISGINVILRWEISGQIPLEFTVVGSDTIAGVKSFNILVHDKYSVAYSFTDDSTEEFADSEIIDLGVQTSDKILTVKPVAPSGDSTDLVGCEFEIYDKDNNLLYTETYNGTPLKFRMPHFYTYRVECSKNLTIGGITYFNPHADNRIGFMKEDVLVEMQFGSTEHITNIGDVKAFLALEDIDIETKRLALVSSATNDFKFNLEITNPSTQVKYTMPVRIMEIDNYNKMVDGNIVQFVGARCMFAYCLPDTIPFDEREQVVATGETYESGINYYQGTRATLGDQSFTPLVEGVDYQVGDVVGENIYKHAWSNTQYGTGNSSTAMLMRYGSNIYHESNIDKWLNAQGDNWFTPSHLGDVLASWYNGKKGFKSWFKADDLAFIEENVEYGVYERANFELPNNKIYRQFVLPSGTNIAGSVNANEGLCFDYWKYLNGGIISNSANANRTITKVNATTSKQTIWLRSPNRSNSCNAWILGSSGDVNNYNTYLASGVAPAFTI